MTFHESFLLYDPETVREELDTLTFSETLDEYLWRLTKGPDESDGYSDKAFYTRMHGLRERMNKLAPIK